MELVLDEKDIKRILLSWAEKDWGSASFNTVEIRASYGSLSGVTLSYEKPDPVIEKVKEALE